MNGLTHDKLLKIILSATIGATLAVALGLVLTYIILKISVYSMPESNIWNIFFKLFGILLIEFAGFRISVFVYFVSHDFIELLIYGGLFLTLIPIVSLIIGGFISAKLIKINDLWIGVLTSTEYTILILLITYATFPEFFMAEDTLMVIIQIFILGLIFCGIGIKVGKIRLSSLI